MTHIELSVGLHEGNLFTASSNELSRSASTAALSLSDITECQQSSDNCSTSSPAAARQCDVRKPRASSVRGRAAFFEAMIASPRGASPPHDPCSNTSPPGCPAVSKHAAGFIMCLWVLLPWSLGHTCMLNACSHQVRCTASIPSFLTIKSCCSRNWSSTGHWLAHLSYHWLHPLGKRWKW